MKKGFPLHPFPKTLKKSHRGIGYSRSLGGFASQFGKGKYSFWWRFFKKLSRGWGVEPHGNDILFIAQATAEAAEGLIFIAALAVGAGRRVDQTAVNLLKEVVPQVGEGSKVADRHAAGIVHAKASGGRPIGIEIDHGGANGSHPHQDLTLLLILIRQGGKEFTLLLGVDAGRNGVAIVAGSNIKSLQLPIKGE